MMITFFLALRVSPALALTVGEITKDLTCTCGCNMVVSACEGTMECDPAKQITDEAARLINEGRSKDEIIRYFVQTKGERILAAPTKKGFNLTAWILPFLAIVIGGLGLIAFLNKCLSTRKDTADGAEYLDKAPTTDKKYLDQFEKELKSFE
jgi:cytochrome c-type biogenesis protein CcmH